MPHDAGVRRRTRPTAATESATVVRTARGRGRGRARHDEHGSVRDRTRRHPLAVRHAAQPRSRPDHIPGGSSSGSAVAVARGLVPFALGTDTAGSGRVPAACTNTVGLKPTRGLVSTRGVVPAVPGLDCISVHALTVADAFRVLAAIGGFDDRDPWSRAMPPWRGPGAASPRRRLGPRRGDRDRVRTAAGRRARTATPARSSRALSRRTRDRRRHRAVLRGRRAALRTVGRGALRGVRRVRRRAPRRGRTGRRADRAARAQTSPAPTCSPRRTSCWRSDAQSTNTFADVDVLVVPTIPVLPDPRRGRGRSDRRQRAPVALHRLRQPARPVRGRGARRAARRRSAVRRHRDRAGGADPLVADVAARLHAAVGGTLGATSIPVPTEPWPDGQPARRRGARRGGGRAPARAPAAPRAHRV